MRMPGFHAEMSLRPAGGPYRTAAVAASSPGRVQPQWKCPCPAGLLAKASSLCHGTTGPWCAILDHCFDCFGD